MTDLQQRIDAAIARHGFTKADLRRARRRNVMIKVGAAISRTMRDLNAAASTSSNAADAFVLYGKAINKLRKYPRGDLQ